MKQRPPTEPNYIHRLNLLYLVLFLCMVTLIGGLAWRQLFLTKDYLAAEERQNYRRILKPGPRGDIFDRHGELLVGNRALFSATVYLNELRPDFRREFIRVLNERRARGLSPDRYRLAVEARRNVVQHYQNQINQILGIRDIVEASSIERHFSQSLLLPYPLKRDLAPGEYARLIEQLPVDSPIQIITDTARYYPFGEAAAHVLGYVTDSQEISPGDLPGKDLLTFRFEGKVGRTGLEASFDHHLQGITGGEIWSVDPGGFQHERVVFEQPRTGQSLTTTLDVRLQQATEEALGDYTGAAIAIDIATGEVLAMASKPNYNLNDLTPFIPFTVDAVIREEGGWLNRATQGLYPPGSTFKIITATAGLRAGLIDNEMEINCPGYYRVGRRIFRCHNRAGHGRENLVESIRDSCNVFFYERGLAIGINRLAEEARYYNLHQPTGIEIPGETRRSLVPDRDWKSRRFYGESWFDGDTANMSIGQGFLLVTPLQMTLVASAIADGYLRQPTLIKDPSLTPNREPPKHLNLPEEHLNWIRKGMTEAGIRGTARRASGPGFIAAGKTGTAQVRKDSRPTTLAWYIGYAPADNPKIAVCVMIEGAPSSESLAGGGTSAPIARRIFETHLQPATTTHIE